MSFTHQIFPNFLTKEECDVLLGFSLDNLTLKPASLTININPDKIRKSKVEFYNYNEKFPFLMEKIEKVVNEYLHVKGCDFNYKNSEFQFTEYKVGDFFNWHVDVDTYQPIKKRYCSVVILLNEDYEGGDLEIKLHDGNTIKLDKKIGNMVIFLSTMEHRVTPILRGDRYSLVNWIGVIPNNNYKNTLI